MLPWPRRAFILALAFLSACKSDGTSGPGPNPPNPGPPTITKVDFSFEGGFAGWTAAYSDYSPGQEASIAFASGHERLPAPLDNMFGIFLSGHNRSADLFMYASRPVTGLAPNTRYRVDISVNMASNVPPGCVGIGGAPGESVFVKAGGTRTPPGNMVQAGRITTDFDKGNQSQSGTNAIVIGNIAFGAGSCTSGTYQRKTLSTGIQGPIIVSDAQGRLWLIIGTDSGFEGSTKVYLIDGQATLTPL